MLTDYFNAFDALALALFIVFLGLWVLSLIFLVVSYVFESLGLYATAKRRAIRHAWLAWIPVGKSWILGSLSDQYAYVVKHKVTNRRKILLLLSVAGLLIGIICLTLISPIQYQITLHNFHRHYNPYAHVGSTLMMYSMGACIFSALWGCISIVKTVYRYIALYDFYSSCSPVNNVLFLVLSIFLPFTRPFFVFSCRNRDDGMPPRREQARQTPPDFHDPSGQQPCGGEFL